MKVEEIATWVGLFTAVAGSAINYGITENKVANLESKMDELYNVTEIRTMEKRLTTLEVTQENSDLSRLAPVIATIEGQINHVEATVKRLESSVIEVQNNDDGEINNDVRINQSRISAIKIEIDFVKSKVDRINQKLDRLRDKGNPLG